MSGRIEILDRLLAALIGMMHEAVGPTTARYAHLSGHLRHHHSGNRIKKQLRCDDAGAAWLPGRAGKAVRRYEALARQQGRIEASAPFQALAL